MQTKPAAIELHGYGMVLREITEDDLESLRCWRNQPDISRYMLNKETISPEQQRAWFVAIQGSLSQQHFAICYKEQLIGAANIKEQLQLPIIRAMERHKLRVEPGIYLGDQRFRSNVLAFAPSLLLLDYCFETLSLPKLFATVHEDNEAALNYNEKLGYRKTTSHNGWVSIELDKQHYDEATVTVKRFLSRRTKNE